MTVALVTNAQVHGVGMVDVHIREGRVHAVLPARQAECSPIDPTAAPVLDAGGGLLLPTLVDGHCHPDKTTWGEGWVSRRPAGSLQEVIANDVKLQKAMETGVAIRAGRLLATYVARGARAVRAHVDVAPVHGLDNLRGVREAADSLGHALDVQIVAFPQLGILRAPGTAALLREAVEAGATAVGGIDPVGLDGDLDAHLDIVFGVATEFGVEADIHLHDRGPVGIAQVHEILRRTEALGLQGRVTIGHAFCYSDAEGAELTTLVDATAAASVSLATYALGDFPALPLAALRSAGVRVVLGSDGVRDAWSPFGNADLVDRTHLLAWQTGAATDEDLEACLDLAAHSGADLLGLPRSGLAVGDPADFMVLDAASPAQAVIDRPTPRWVLKAGRPVARDGHLIRD